MKISVHQPHYHPWIGYFDKIQKSDVFVYLDNVQYKKREFQNRNKIRTKDGWVWLTVPVVTKGNYFQKICEVEIDNSNAWLKTHWEMIKANYKKAEYFLAHKDFFENIYSAKWNRLMDISVKITEYLLEQFQIKTKICYESDMDVSAVSTDRIIQICKKLGADTYLTGQGAREYMDEKRFEQEGIALQWQEFEHPVYKQVYEGFEPCMSAIDLLFNCGTESSEIIRGIK